MRGPALGAWLLFALAACGGERAPEESAGEPIDGVPASAEIRWTSGPATAPPTVRSGTSLLTALRAGSEAGFERVVLDLDERGDGFPEYQVAYVDRPLIDCGSGEETAPIGAAWLEIRLYPTDAHTQEGRATISHRPQDLPGLVNLRRVYTTCDFEAVVILVLAMESRREFRVLELESPRRIVVDVRK